MITASAAPGFKGGAAVGVRRHEQVETTTATARTAHLDLKYRFTNLRSQAEARVIAWEAGL
jgi:hypothetical protein